MNKKILYPLAFFVLLSAFVFSGCRSTNRSLSVLAWDRNVTVVKKPKRGKLGNRTKAITPGKGIRRGGRAKAIRARRHNRASKKAGRY